MSRVPIKGEPDFTGMSDKKIKACLEAVQDLLFVYKYCDLKKVEVLSSAWKDLSHEDTKRTAESAFKALDKEENREIKAQKRIIKPVKIRR